MNVLLAEANVSYDNLLEPKDVNPKMKTIDVVIVIGANDVVNPSAMNSLEALYMECQLLRLIEPKL